MKKLLPLLLLLFFASCATHQESDQEALEARILRIENGLMLPLQIKGETPKTFNINDRLKELEIPGLSIAFVNDDKVEWARAYGMADVGENRPMTTETMLLAGSISKPVAALRAHQMVESGAFDLDKNVNDYLTSWKLPENNFTENEKVTLRRILNHTAGLTVWGFPGYDKGDDIPSVPDVLDGKGNTDEVRVYKEPGESWMYSGGGYTIMQLMITDTEGKSFPETMQNNVLDPLNMKSSTFENPLPEKYHALAATGYRGNGEEVEGKWPIYPEMAAAGLWTTPTQLIQYAIEIQKIYSSKEDGLLRYETVAEMLTPGMNNHGLGPQTEEELFGHGGADEGFRANMIAWKNKPYAVVIMVNSDNGSIMRELELALAQEYDLPGIEPDLREVINMSDEQLQRFVGTYNIDGVGVLEVKIEESHLTFEAPFINPTMHALAENDSSFFDRNSGTRVVFDLEEGKATGFTVPGQGLKAVRQE